MKKLITALDGLRLHQPTIQTATTLAKQLNAHLVGVFLDDFSRNSFSVYEAIEEGEFSEKRLKKLAEKDSQIRDQAVETFELACQEAKIPYSIHRDKAFAIQDLLRESIYADLLIINAHESFSRRAEPSPSRFMKALLAEVQCPVLITPERYEPLQKVIMLYDGAPASVFAIKMFSHIMGESLQTQNIPTTKNTAPIKKEALPIQNTTTMGEGLPTQAPHQTSNIPLETTPTEPHHIANITLDTFPTQELSDNSQETVSTDRHHIGNTLLDTFPTQEPTHISNIPQQTPPTIEILTIKQDDLHLPENKLMKEFMKRHCPHATYTVIKGDPEKEIIAHLHRKGPDTLVVLGAYQRSAVSRWFKESMADTLIKLTACPLFIAHNK